MIVHSHAIVVLSLMVLTGCALDQVGDGGGRGQSFSVPVVDTAGTTRSLTARLCRPTGGGDAPLVVIAHGSPASTERSGMQLHGCDEEAARWFTGRGYAVAFALRRGYGATGGSWAETFGSCAQADYTTAGRETARDIDATIRTATALPGIRPTGVIVVGQSAGGWGTIAYNSLPHPQVTAMIVMAGGRGGRQGHVANQNCHPERLATAAGEYGTTSTTPMLWVYAANDSFFAPPIAEAMHAAFTQSGGKAELVQPGRFRRDGHGLFFGPGGSAVWGPLFQQYLVARGAG